MSAKSTDFSKRIERILQNNAERKDFYEALEHLSVNSPIVLRRNRLRHPREAEYQHWVDRPVPWSADSFFAKTELRPEFRHHPYVLSGALYWQEGAATEAVEVLDPQPDDLVLDLCAAPGSKSTQIAERLGLGRGWLFANDVNRSRATKLRDILGRHGALWTTLSSLNSERLVEKFPETFDRILVDAPCSGESLLAKRSDDRSDVKDRDVQHCANIQRKLLMDALELLKPGGHILYSTCTYSLEENEELIRAVQLETPAEFEILREQRRWPHLDRVPGGYFALLRKTEAHFRSHLPDLGNWDGILESGGVGWDGEVNRFAMAMAPDDTPLTRQRPTGSKAVARVEELGLCDFHLEDRALASAFYSGQAIRHSSFQGGGNFRLFYQGCVIGGGKGVDGRINGWLPKGLRI